MIYFEKAVEFKGSNKTKVYYLIKKVILNGKITLEQSI